MSDQQVMPHPSRAAHTVGVGWLPIVEAVGSNRAHHLCRLLQQGDISPVLDPGDIPGEAFAGPAGRLSIYVPECHYERACEIIARAHAESFQGRDDDDDFFDDDDDDSDSDLDDDDDDDDDVFFDDDIDDDFDDDDDDDDDDDVVDSKPDNK